MMKRLKKLFIMMMSLTVFLSLAYTQVCAYGYKVTLYTGNQGTINSQNEMSINVSKGQMVSLDLSQIELPQDSKYYVKGIRLSGHDSVDNLDPATFVVNGDLDYVVVYGVKGNQVAYTIRYVDENGKQLSEDTVLYGNVGDKPVVAYKYIDSYIPQAYALTKTLVENEKENVFTFTYKPGETGEIIENTKQDIDIIKKCNCIISTRRKEEFTLDNIIAIILNKPILVSNVGINKLIFKQENIFYNSDELKEKMKSNIEENKDFEKYYDIELNEREEILKSESI